MQGEAIEK